MLKKVFTLLTDAIEKPLFIENDTNIWDDYEAELLEKKYDEDNLS